VLVYCVKVSEVITEIQILRTDKEKVNFSLYAGYGDLGSVTISFTKWKHILAV
jgi:hypothetical protein